MTNLCVMIFLRYLIILSCQKCSTDSRDPTKRESLKRPIPISHEPFYFSWHVIFSLKKLKATKARNPTQLYCSLLETVKSQACLLEVFLFLSGKSTLWLRFFREEKFQFFKGRIITLELIYFYKHQSITCVTLRRCMNIDSYYFKYETNHTLPEEALLIGLFIYSTKRVFGKIVWVVPVNTPDISNICHRERHEKGLPVLVLRTLVAKLPYTIR